jgi:hypothetical protein
MGLGSANRFGKRNPAGNGKRPPAPVIEDQHRLANGKSSRLCSIIGVEQ